MATATRQAMQDFIAFIECVENVVLLLAVTVCL
jgi:hypothetical protein